MNLPPLPHELKLPPIPEPRWGACDPNTCEVCEPVYTADQIREYGVLCARWAREEAAKRCDQQIAVYEAKMEQAGESDRWDRWDRMSDYKDAVGNIAAAIRKE